MFEIWGLSPFWECLFVSSSPLCLKFTLLLPYLFFLYKVLDNQYVVYSLPFIFSGKLELNRQYLKKNSCQLQALNDQSKEKENYWISLPMIAQDEAGWNLALKDIVDIAKGPSKGICLYMYKSSQGCLEGLKNYRDTAVTNRHVRPRWRWNRRCMVESHDESLWLLMKKFRYVLQSDRKSLEA